MNKFNWSQLILICFLLLMACKKEEAMYTDSYGNSISEKDNLKNALEGNWKISCNQFYSSGGYSGSFEFTTTIEKSPKPDYFTIGVIQFSKYNSNKSKTKSAFKLENLTQFRIDKITSSWGDYKFNTYFDTTINELDITISEADGGGDYCFCRGVKQ